MPHFRKRPVVIEARLVPTWTDDRVAEFVAEAVALAEWCGGKSHLMAEDEPAFDGAPVVGPYLSVPTLEGEMIARSGDYIIRGVAGEFYPRKPSIFEATYEQVELEFNPGWNKGAAHPEDPTTKTEGE